MRALLPIVFVGLTAACAIGCAPEDDKDEPTGGGTTTGASSTGTAGGAGAGGMGAGGMGSGGMGGIGGGAGGGSAMTLVSSAIMPGMVIPDTYTCAGTDVSPPLGWPTPGPATTMSYAIVFTDKTNGFIHWVIYDIPTSATGLAENMPQVYAPPMPAGSKQATSFDDTTFGYKGPCPGGNEHTYEFVLYALDVAKLPKVMMSFTGSEVATEILMHDVATASLSGKSSAM